MKMYILILDDVPFGHALVAAAHASLACYLRFQDDAEVEAWLNGPFYKVVCKANAMEFARACEEPDAVVLTESALDGREVAVALKPRAEFPRWFRFLRLYR